MTNEWCMTIHWQYAPHLRPRGGPASLLPACHCQQESLGAIDRRRKALGLVEPDSLAGSARGLFPFACCSQHMGEISECVALKSQAVGRRSNCDRLSSQTLGFVGLTNPGHRPGPGPKLIDVGINVQRGWAVVVQLP